MVILEQCWWFSTRGRLSAVKRHIAACQWRDIINGRLEHVAKRNYFEVQESLEGGFEAKALSHSIYTEAETLDELKKKVQDAVRCHFEERERPSLIRLHLVRDDVIPA
jgi:hypothetical protein